jgi:hypothetical protein
VSNAYINFTFESKTDWVKKINECQKEIERQKEDKEELQGYYDILNHQCIEQGLEIERLNNIINRIKSIYQSLRFSAPENDYIFIEQLGEVLKELKGSDKE